MPARPRRFEPPTVAALVARRRGDDRIAFVEGATGRSLGWADVVERAGLWARSQRFEPGGRVGLLFSDPLEMAAAFLASVAVGLTAAPLDSSATPSELVAQAARRGLGAVVTGFGDAGQARSALRAAGVDLWASGPGGLEAAGRATTRRSAEPGRGAALVLATSGTTGQPKLIPLTEAQLVLTASAVVGHHRLTRDDLGYSPLPLSHINGLVVGVLSSLIAGQTLVVDRRFSASGFWKVVEDQEATWLNLVPAILAMVASLPAPPAGVASRIRFARSASAPLPVATLRRFEEVTGIAVVETYGMTEAGSQITANPLPPGDRRPGSAGLPVGVELRVVDGGRRPEPAGAIGHVEIRGPSVTTEYWEPADAGSTVRPAINGGWLATGDLGRLDPDGYLYLAGRDDDVINRGGEKVYPRDVEEALLADPAVQAAAVVGRAHPTSGEEPVAFVVAAPGADPAALVDRLAATCREELSRFRRPAEIVLADALPSGPNGKLRRSELRRALAGPAGTAS